MGFAELRPELDAQLAELAAKGRSSSQIARELGITRNAVIGRCRRRGFTLLNPPCRPVVKAAPQPKPKMEPPAPSASPSRSRKGRAPRQFSREAPKVAPLSKKLLAAFAPPPIAQEQREWPTVSILGLTSTTCRWPIGDDPASPDFQYCGAMKEIGPYCSRHGSLAYTPRGIDKVRRDAVKGSRFA